MSIVIKDGETLTLTGGQTLDNGAHDVNGDAFIVRGNGTLNLGHDANSANVTIADAQVTINLAHDLNGNATVTDNGGVLTVGHDANGAKFSISNGGEVRVAHDLNGNATVTDNGGLFTVGHDANGAKFSISNGGEIELSHAYNGATFALSGENDEIVFGIGNNPVGGGSLNNQITGLNVGDKIELNGQAFSSATFSGNTITLSNGFRLTNVGFVPGSSTTLITGVDPTTGFNYVQVASSGRTISSTTAGPILLQNPNLDNPLVITATGQVISTGSNVDGVDGTTAAAWTITNDGTVSSAGGRGVSLAGAGTVSNGPSSGAPASISGSVVGIGIYGVGTVTNSGRISGTATGSAGVDLALGGSVTNNSGGSISGATNGVVLGTGGSVTNAASASIVGSSNGVLVAVRSGTVVNAGSISATGTNGSGIYLLAGGQVTNNASGLISGRQFGVFIESPLGIVFNSGTILGATDDGVVLGAGGSVTNAAGAAIGGDNVGVYAKYRAAGTVTNSGSISGTATGSAGVDLALGGSVTNNSGGSISGSSFGVFMTGASGTVVNAGSIAGTNNIGVDLLAGGNVTNAAGASISASGIGVAVYGSGGTVTNAGTISGSFLAVDFGNGANNRLVVDPGAVFNGGVAAGSGANTLELAQGASAGSIGGIGTSFTGFNTAAVDGGANWTLTGSNSAGTLFNNGTLAIASGGSLDVTVAVDPASTGLFDLNSNALLEIAADVGSGDNIAFLGPAEAIIDTASQFGTNVGHSNYAGPLIEDFGSGDNIDLKDVVSAGLTLNYSSVTGLLQVASGATGVASLLFQNSGLGSGTFHLADDGSGHALITLA